MYNIHLERDHKDHRYQAMKWERREVSNEIVGTDNSVKHHYSYKSRKKMNSDWQELMKDKLKP